MNAGLSARNGQRCKLYLVVRSGQLQEHCSRASPAAHVLACHREAFERLDIPEELLVQSMKTAVERHVLREEPRFNSGFLDFCEHYTVAPV